MLSSPLLHPSAHVSVCFNSFLGSLSSIGLQGEAGAYSEKSLRELLGKHVVAVGHESFEDAFRAVGHYFVYILAVESWLGPCRSTFTETHGLSALPVAR